MIKTCDLLKELSQDTWNRIKFSRSRHGLKIYEVTITQNLIYEINRKSRTPDISIYEAIDEATNGNDIELFIKTQKGFLFIPVQSKILYKSQDYPRMEHGNQINDLINYASSKGGVPFYLLYNYSPGFAFNDKINNITCSASDFGCTLIEADYLLNKFEGQRTDKHGSLRWVIPTFTDLHPSPAIPWFIPFCVGQNQPDKKENFQNLFHTISEEQLSNLKIYSEAEIEEDTNWNFLDITKEKYEEIPNIEKAKYEDIQSKEFYSETKFSPKFRIIFRGK